MSISVYLIVNVTAKCSASAFKHFQEFDPLQIQSFDDDKNCDADTSFFNADDSTELTVHTLDLQQDLFDNILFQSDTIQYSIFDTVPKPKKKKNYLNIEGLAMESQAINGLPPIYTLERSDWYYDSNVSAKVSLGIIPIKIDYRYSNYSTATGLTNAFKLTFDSAKFKSNLEGKTQERVDSLTKDAGNIRGKIEQLQQQLLSKKRNVKDIEGIGEKDRTDLNHRREIFSPFDTLNSNGNRKIPIYIYSDSLTLGSSFHEKIPNSSNSSIDSLAQKIDEMTSRLQLIERKIADLRSNPLEHSHSENGKEQFFTKYLKHTSKLNIGICNPSNGIFLLNGTPLQGFQYENTYKRFFTAVAIGKIQNSTRGMSTRESSESTNRNGWLANKSNTFNRRISLLQAGVIGKENGSIKLGFSKVEPTDMNKSANASQSNIVSLDGEYKLLAGISLNASFARSNNLSNSIKDDESRLRKSKGNLAFGGGFTGKIAKTKTEFDGSAQMVQPNFYNPALYFLRSDNTNYKFQVKQRIFKKTSVRGFFSQALDGALAQSEYQTEVRKWGVEVKQKIGKSIQLCSTYSKLLALSNYTLSDTLSGQSTFGLNETNLSNSYFLSQAVLFNKRIKELFFGLNTFVSYYHFEQWNSENNFIILNSNLSVNYRNFNCSGNYAIQANLGSFANRLFENRTMIDVMGEYTYEKLKIGVGLNSLQSDRESVQFGYMGRCEYQLGKSVSFSIRYEEIIPNGFNESLLIEFEKALDYRLICGLKLQVI